MTRKYYYDTWAKITGIIVSKTLNFKLQSISKKNSIFEGKILNCQIILIPNKNYPIKSGTVYNFNRHCKPEI